MRAVNGWIGVSPFKKREVRPSLKSGFATVANSQELVSLQVIHGTDEYPEGSTVYVPAEAAVHAPVVYELEGVPFCLLQTSLVKLVDKKSQVDSQ